MIVKRKVWVLIGNALDDSNDAIWDVGDQWIVCVYDDKEAAEQHLHLLEEAVKHSKKWKNKKTQRKRIQDIEATLDPTCQYCGPDGIGYCLYATTLYSHVDEFKEGNHL